MGHNHPLLVWDLETSGYSILLYVWHCEPCTIVDLNYGIVRRWRRSARIQQSCKQKSSSIFCSILRHIQLSFCNSWRRSLDQNI